jgi:hypothetical protein
MDIAYLQCELQNFPGWNLLFYLYFSKVGVILSICVCPAHLD